MKVILLGSTGFIGNKVLQYCLQHPAITSVVALSRRNLAEEAANPKLSVVILEQFDSYPESVLECLKDADACIWSIGTYNWDKTVELEYPEAFQKALLKVLDTTKPFRYIYLGGAFTEQDQQKTLWFFAGGRRVRGLAESRFLEFGRQNQHVQTFVVKPAAVMARGSYAAVLGCVLPTVWIDELAAVMADLAVNGGMQQMVLNEDIVQRGRQLLRSEF